DQMCEQVMTICETHTIVVTWCDRSTQAIALSICEEICIPEIKSVISYATALHELGHILWAVSTQQGDAGPRDLGMALARNKALIWTDRMERNAQASLDWFRPRVKMFDARDAKWRREHADEIAEVKRRFGSICSKRVALSTSRMVCDQ